MALRVESPANRCQVPLMWRVPIVTAFLLVTSGCSDSRKPREAPAVDRTGMVLLTESADVCECVGAEMEVEFGNLDGPGALAQVTGFVAVDPAGRYWVSQPGGPEVFAPNGVHIAQVGREGQGPGEFQAQGPIYVDQGVVNVVDGGNARVTVFRDTTYVSDWRIPGYFLAVEPLPDGRLYVNMPTMAPERYGEPLHLTRRDTILSSFGLIGSGHVRLDDDRVIATSADGSLYSFRRNDYAGNVWDSEGRHLGSLMRRGVWDPPPDGRATPLTPVTPELYGVVRAARFDANGRLRVLLWVPREDYRDHLREAQGPAGAILVPADGEEALFRSVLEVIDLEAGEVVAWGELPDLMVGFVDDDRLFSSPVVGVGVPTVRVWRINSSR